MIDTSFLMPFFLGAAFAAFAVAIQLVVAREKVAQSGHFALGMILAIYIGARLSSGSLTVALAESAFAGVVLLLSLAALQTKPRLVGVLIILHGLYDQIFAHSAGLPEWYPPLCLGVDIVLGIGVWIWGASAPQSRDA